jgi:anti-sigma factor RsiW
MPKHSDEALVAYLDGELDSAERRHVEAWLEADPAVRDRLAALAQSVDLVRSAYVDIVDEPVPPRLIAAASGAGGTAQAAPLEAEILVLKRQSRTAAAVPYRRWQVGLAAAAGLFGMVFGGAGTYFGMGLFNPASPTAEARLAAVAANNSWLDNAAGYYKLTVNAGDNMLIDVPASNDTSEALQKISQGLPQQVRLPDLKPWGLSFRGARLVVVDGRPAAQLVYVTDNKAIGPLTLVIGASKQPDIPRTFERRQDVNLLYWRHQGRAYALVGQTDIGWLWGIANDVAWQLDAI